MNPVVRGPWASDFDHVSPRCESTYVGVRCMLTAHGRERAHHHWVSGPNQEHRYVEWVDCQDCDVGMSFADGA